MDKKIFFILIISFSLISLNLFFVNADVISVDSGGNENITITPNPYIEGFFSGIPVSVPPTPPTDGGGDGVSINFALEPDEIIKTLKINSIFDQVITVQNLGTNQITLSISQQGLDNMIIFEQESLVLDGGETKELKVKFVAPNEPGIYTGKIIIGSKEIPVTLDVKTKILLFDVNIIILNAGYRVIKGEELETQVTLIPLGDIERLDVTLNYEITDDEGETYLKKKETLLVEEQVNLKRNFDIESFPSGKYNIDLELIYPGGIAVSGAFFRIISSFAEIFSGKILFYLIIILLVIGILIIGLLIIRNLKKKTSQAPY